MKAVLYECLAWRQTDVPATTWAIGTACIRPVPIMLCDDDDDDAATHTHTHTHTHNYNCLSLYA